MKCSCDKKTLSIPNNDDDDGIVVVVLQKLE